MLPRSATVLLAISFSIAAPVSAQDWVRVRSFTDTTFTDVDFADADRGAVAGAFGVDGFSLDGGLSWFAGTNFDTESANAVCMLPSGTALVARHRLWRSTDTGRTWERVEEVPDGLNIADFQAVGTRVLMIRSGEIWASDDDGLHWSRKLEGDEAPLSFYKLRFVSPRVGYALGGSLNDAGSAAHVARTEDGGETWTSAILPIKRVDAGDFESARRGLVATYEGKLYRTEDGAASFAAVEGDFPRDTYLHDLRFRAPDRYYAATTDGRILLSMDSGTHWREVFRDDDGRSLNALSVQPAATIAVGNGGLVVQENLVFRDGFDPSR